MPYSLKTRNDINNMAFRNASWTMPVAGYAALFLTDPSPGSAGGVATGTECTYTGYARQAVTFAASSGGVIANSTTITFPTSGSINGTANFVAFYDAVSGGNFIAGFTISATPINVGTAPSVAIGAMTMTLT